MYDSSVNTMYTATFFLFVSFPFVLIGYYLYANWKKIRRLKQYEQELDSISEKEAEEKEQKRLSYIREYIKSHPQKQ